MIKKPIPLIEFTVPGDPVGKERPRVANGRAYTPRKTTEYERAIADYGSYAAMGLYRELPDDGWYILELDIRHSSNRYPDADNVVKSVMDALEGIVWANDKRVVPRVMSVSTKCQPCGIDVRIYQCIT